MVAVAVTDSGRPLPRVGGLTAEGRRGSRRPALRFRDRAETMSDRKDSGRDGEAVEGYRLDSQVGFLLRRSEPAAQRRSSPRSCRTA